MRIAPRVLGQQADDGQKLAGALLALGLGVQAVHGHRLDQDLAHGHARIERGVGVLEDDLHVAAQLAQRLLVEVRDLLALEAHRARRRIHQAQHQPAGRRLAAARFAHQRQGLAAGDLEGHALDGAHHADHPAADQAARDREVLYETPHIKNGDLEHRCRRAHAAFLASSTGAFQQATWWPAPMLRERRRLLAALPVGEGAARREAAALGLVVGAGHRALDGRQPLAIDVEPRDRAQKADRVGVLRIGEQGRDRRAFDDLAGVHDDHLVGHLGDDAEIVGDDQDRHAQPLLQVGQQVEDLRLDGDVERRGRLVGDQQRGLAARAPWRS